MHVCAYTHTHTPLPFIILLHLWLFFNWQVITLQYCDGFCHTSTWIHHRLTFVPSLQNQPPYLPPHLIPPGCHRAPALGALHHVSNSHWLSVVHMVAFMFQYYSLKSSHPLLLPNEWIRKLWYIYTMKYYSAIKRNAFESVLMRWMNLEPIIQNEISQKEKDKYCMLLYICEYIYGI